MEAAVPQKQPNQSTLPAIWRVPDDLWSVVERVLTELDPPARTGRKRIDARDTLGRTRPTAPLVRDLFELEEAFREGGSPDPVLVYDAEGDLYRFREDGRFALSRERADWRGLKEIGYFSAWGM